MTLQAVETAAEADGYCRYPVKYQEGFAALLPHAPRMPETARLLALQARTAAQRGDRPLAIHSVRRILDLAATLDEAIVDVEHWVRNALLRIALVEIQGLLNEFAWSDDELRTFEELIARPTFQESTVNSLLAYRVFALHAFDHPKTIQSLSSNLEDLELRPWQIGPADRLNLLKELRLILAATREGLWQGRVAAVEATDRHRARPRKEQYFIVMSGLLVPSLVPSFDTRLATEARRRIVAVEIAAARFHLRHGRLPRDLAELVPEFLPAAPRDPFGEGPLGLRFGEDELTVWSTDRDLTDEGGQGDLKRGETDLVGRLKLLP